MKKKWFIIILIILVIAVVLTIVFINLFTPKNTKEVTDKLYSVTEQGYLLEENEDNLKIDEFLKYLQSQNVSNQLEQEERNQVKNYYEAYQAFEILADFYNREMPYSFASDAYKKERKTVLNSFDNATQAAKAMADYIRQEEVKTNGEAKWTADMWRTIDDQMASLHNNTVNAFNHLAIIYTGSISSKIMNNDLTTVLFRAVNQLTNDFDENYTKEQNCGNDLLVFVDCYFTKDAEHFILDYQYDVNEQTWVKYLIEAEDITKAENDAWNKLLIGAIGVPAPQGV